MMQPQTFGTLHQTVRSAGAHVLTLDTFLIAGHMTCQTLHPTGQQQPVEVAVKIDPDRPIVSPEKGGEGPCVELPVYVVFLGFPVP